MGQVLRGIGKKSSQTPISHEDPEKQSLAKKQRTTNRWSIVTIPKELRTGDNK